MKLRWRRWRRRRAYKLLWGHAPLEATSDHSLAAVYVLLSNKLLDPATNNPDAVARLASEDARRRMYRIVFDRVQNG